MRFAFGSFLLDLETRQLFRNGEEIHLTPKAFALLTILVERRPRAVSKADLYEHLWPSTFVSESNFAVLVTEIRTALGDAPRRPKFIRTIHGFGYAFCGEAEAAIPGSGKQTALSAACWLVSEVRQIPLLEGENLVGRDPHAGAWLDASSVSRRHARIVIKGGQARLEDLGSKNGTWLKGSRLATPAGLVDGDEVRFGSVALTFRVRVDSGTTDTQRS